MFSLALTVICIGAIGIIAVSYISAAKNQKIN